MIETYNSKPASAADLEQLEHELSRAEKAWEEAQEAAGQAAERYNATGWELAQEKKKRKTRPEFGGYYNTRASVAHDKAVAELEKAKQRAADLAQRVKLLRRLVAKTKHRLLLENEGGSNA